MHGEIAELISAMTAQSDSRIERIGMRDYHVGELDGQPCVVALARIGKVAAAATTVTLIREFGVTEIIFTGLAGGIAAQAKVGDVVLADQLIQHDLDASPIFPRYEVPLLGRSTFATDMALSAELKIAAEGFLRDDLPHAITQKNQDIFQLQQVALHVGTIASGDQFISDIAHANRIATALPEVLAVEMEGAAVAQICYEYGVPYAVLRTISDRADATAHVDFGQFLDGVASHYSAGIVRQFLSERSSGSLNTQK